VQAINPGPINEARAANLSSWNNLDRKSRGRVYLSGCRVSKSSRLQVAYAVVAVRSVSCSW
jgi:hypothetical protein